MNIYLLAGEIVDQNDYANIVSIVEQTFACKINAAAPLESEIELTPISDIDDIAAVKHSIDNQHLLTPAHINDLIAKQLSTFTISDPIATWSQYVNYAVDMLAAVKYRVAAGYEYNCLLPTQQQLFELQHYCIKFQGNLSYFYLVYLQMCESAHITRYSYMDIDKYLATDKYISLVDMSLRKELAEENIEKYIKPYLRQGGMCAQGHSDIDATTINNLFYYKTARQIFYYRIAKQLITETKQLENYGQLPQPQREQLWNAIVKAYPDDAPEDKNCIFYKFAKFISETPGEFYHYFSKEIPELAKLSDAQMYEVIKVAGIHCKKLVIVSRSVTENWQPRRYLSLQWQRKHDLDICYKNKKITVRKVGDKECVRIWPNEMPYCPSHGLSICGSGLVEGFAEYGTFAYEWNTPVDPAAQINNIPRDVEKLFRELKFFDSQEYKVNMFQNTVAYSSIQQTQHTHISRGTLDTYPIYSLSAAQSISFETFTVELVQIGELADALLVRVNFDNLEDEELIKYLIALNAVVFTHYDGPDYVDVYMQIFRTKDDRYAFIYEPHARLLVKQNGTFINPDNNEITLRKPQWVIPEGHNIKPMKNEFAAGLDYLRKFFDDVCKLDMQRVILNFTNQYQKTHQ